MNSQKDSLQKKKENFFFTKPRQYSLWKKPRKEKKGNGCKKGSSKDNIKGAAGQKFAEKPCKSKQKNSNMDLCNPFIQ